MELHQARRLLRLRRRLLQIARTRRHEIACQPPWGGKRSFAFGLGIWILRDDSAACNGSTACVLGHAALLPEFQDAGLKIRFSFGSKLGTIAYKGFENIRAGQAFFGLNDLEARRLFLCARLKDLPSPQGRAGVIVSIVRNHHPGLVKGLRGAPSTYLTRMTNEDWL